MHRHNTGHWYVESSLLKNALNLNLCSDCGQASIFVDASALDPEANSTPPGEPKKYHTDFLVPIRYYLGNFTHSQSWPMLGFFRSSEAEFTTQDPEFPEKDHRYYDVMKSDVFHLGNVFRKTVLASAPSSPTWTVSSTCWCRLTTATAKILGSAVLVA